MQLWSRQIVLIAVDAILISLAVYSSLLLRFDGNIPAAYIESYWRLAPLFIGVTLIFLAGMNLYHRIWEYASIREMIAILRATSCALVVTIIAIYLLKLPGFPRSVYILSWLMVSALIGASRISWRILRDFVLKGKAKASHKVLIVGAGDAGAMLAREIQNNPPLKLKAVGFIDDDIHKQKAVLHGIPVLGNRSRIPEIVKEYQVEEILIAMPSLPGYVIREIYDLSRQTSAQVKILPGIYESSSPNLVANLRKVRMEDLLRRKPVQTDLEAISGYLSGQTIMVTGAGGSIGSELCRQILVLQPSKLILVDNCESYLFDIEQEMLRTRLDSEIIPELLDIRNYDKVEAVFRRHHPQVVFHAAAYKHVPMMELHPGEALDNNVLGTRNVAELADRYQVKTFILVSTDKAVNPTSIMGASKRLAELVVKDISRHSQTCFAAVRFGNVLGSRGSVVPTFFKQIKRGGPVTVTHPEMKRYFMTIPEAVQLIIEAGALAQGGEIFVLDMGKQVKIDDLARDLIRLSGLEPDRDIKISYTGIRPGEKLYEELFSSREKMAATQHERIFISKKELDENYAGINKTISFLVKNALTDRRQAVNLIQNLVPEYQHHEQQSYPLPPTGEVGYLQQAAR